MKLQKKCFGCIIPTLKIINNFMTKKEIVRLRERIMNIWNELDEEIGETNLINLVEELVDLEITLELESNQ